MEGLLFLSAKSNQKQSCNRSVSSCILHQTCTHLLSYMSSKPTIYSNGIHIKDDRHLSNLRLNLMRGLYFLNFISLAFDNWGTILFPTEQLDTLSGVAISFWASFSLLMLIGIRFPARMLPLLLLQFLYKSAWVIGVYLPAYWAGTVDEYLQSFLYVCIAGISLNLAIIPWSFFYKNYLKGYFNFN